MMMGRCDICGFLKPINWDTCPVCVYGIDPDSVGRVHCRNCDTLIGEHKIMPGGEYHEYVDKCDYCDPPPNATDEDIVQRFHFWSFSKDGKPERILVERTRKEIRRHKKANEEFEAYVKEVIEEAKNPPNSNA